MADDKESLYATIMIKSGEERAKSIAYAIALVTLEPFIAIHWGSYEDEFSGSREEFMSFQDDVFKAMAKFVQSLYDMDDFNRIVDAEKIRNESKEFQRNINTFLGICSESGADASSSVSEGRIDLARITVLSELDIGYIRARYCCLRMDFVQAITTFGADERCLSERHLSKAVESMKEYVPLKVNQKKHLLGELKDAECFCLIDALYMESWKGMKIGELNKHLPSELLGDFVEEIHYMMYLLVTSKVDGLREDHRLLVYPLRSCLYGEYWINEAVDAVICADIERRCSGRRFIGADHLLSCLLQTRLGVYLKKLSSSLQEVAEEEGPCLYDIYKSAHDVAMFLGCGVVVKLKHLCLATVFFRRHGCGWEDVVELPEVKEFLENAKYRKNEFGDEAPAKVCHGSELWSMFLPFGSPKRRIENTSTLKVVRDIVGAMENGFSPLRKVFEDLDLI